MYISILYIITVCFLVAITIKANKHKPEWLLLLIILSYIKTCITYLFNASTIFTLFTIGSTQVHLDDIVLIVTLLYFVSNIIYPFAGGNFFLCTLLLMIPVGISLFRGVIAGTVGSAVFLGDVRKYIIFLTVFYAVYFCVRRDNALDRTWKYEYYIDNLMNIILVYVLIVWVLDLAFGINSLPGQQGGTLSDGGSTFRIINPPQVLMIAIYALYKAYKDLQKKKLLTIRTLLFAFVVLLLQWRTAVAAFGIGLIILLILFIKENRLSRKLMQEIAVWVVLFLIVFMQGNTESGILGMLTNLFDSFSSISNGTGTFSTRTDAWTQILTSLYGANIVFGRPFGQNLGIEWTASAHSGYVDYISKMGYLGLACLIVFMIYLMGKSIKNKSYVSFVILITISVYWFGYGFSLEQGAVLGFITAILEAKSYNNPVGEHYEKSINVY